MRKKKESPAPPWPPETAEEETPKFAVKAVQYIELTFPEKAEAYNINKWATGDNLTADEAYDLAYQLQVAAEELNG